MIVAMHPSQFNSAKASIADMFGSFRSMRQTGAEALSILEGTFRLLRDQPAWAVEKACLSIQRNGVLRNGSFDRQWPPNDSEIVDAVSKEVRLYGETHRSAVALLEAFVEADGVNPETGGRTIPSQKVPAMGNVVTAESKTVADRNEALT